jgi:hypothetical protein
MSFTRLLPSRELTMTFAFAVCWALVVDGMDMSSAVFSSAESI